MLMRRSPSLIAIAIPTILTAVAVYIALAFATRLTGTLLKLDEDDAGDPQIRPVETSERRAPFVEQAPPPSPELVAQRVRQEIEASRQSAAEVTLPELELGPDPAGPAPANLLPLEPLNLPPPALPSRAVLLPNGTTPSSATEAR